MNLLRRRLLAAGLLGLAATRTGARATGGLRIGVAERSPPLAQQEEGGLAGYDIEVGEAIAAALGARAVFITAPSQALFSRLRDGAIDLALGGLSYTRERLERFAYSLPYVETSLVMLIRAGDINFIRDIGDLNGRVVAIERGSPAEALQALVQQFLRAGHGMGFRELRRYDDLDPAAYTLLEHTRVDVVLHRLPALAHAVRRAPDLFRLVRATGGDAWAGAVARSEDAALAAAASAAIRRLRADGTLARLQRRWFGFELRLPESIPALS